MQVNNGFVPSTGFQQQQPIFSAPAGGGCHPQQQAAPAQQTFQNPQQFLQGVATGFNQLNQGWQGMAGQQQGGGGRTRVAVIDDFNSGHGQRMESTLNQSGADTMRFNIDQPGVQRSTMIANALQDVAARLDRGEDVDAVSLSQQDFVGSADSGRIQQLMQYIQQKHGVPVVVAAGNGGAGQRNTLANGAALSVSNAFQGSDQLDPNSSIGNILQSAPTTSDAAALVAAQAAQLRNRGFGIQSIVSGLQQQAFQQGGALD